jgi:hypothetical protein
MNSRVDGDGCGASLGSHLEARCPPWSLAGFGDPGRAAGEQPVSAGQKGRIDLM